jgi:alkanesulfonate monooxygenase SsuD/methylene tetrahydromethanopterin reductase-like flavin-dependent oxidoreductase (luciferase family)
VTAPACCRGRHRWPHRDECLGDGIDVDAVDVGRSRLSADRWACSYDRPVVLDAQFSTANSSWAQPRDAVVVAEDAGFDAVWVLDHLSGAVFGGDSMFECFTPLGAFAAVTSRIRLGSLVANVANAANVANVANRNPGVLTVAAATLQEISGGRLLLGLGAGASPQGRFASSRLSLSSWIRASAAL